MGRLVGRAVKPEMIGVSMWNVGADVGRVIIGVVVSSSDRNGRPSHNGALVGSSSTSNWGALVGNSGSSADCKDRKAAVGALVGILSLEGAIVGT